MKSPADGRARMDRQLSMLWSGLGLMSGKGMAMLLGFAFWVLAANLYSDDVVGIVGAAISGIMLVGQLSVLGVESSVILLYPGMADERHRLLDTSFSVVAATSLVVSAVLLGVMVMIQGNLAEIAESGPMVVLFILMGTFAAVTTLQDHVSMALRRGDHVIPRNTLNGLLSIVPLLVMVALQSDGKGGAAALFGSWVAGTLAGIALGGYQLLRIKDPYRFRARIDAVMAKRLVRIGAPNHLLTLSERVPVFVTPLLITELISPEATAYWYVVWMAAFVSLLVSRSMSSALLAEMSHNPSKLRSHVRSALRGTLALGGISAVATIILAPFILQVLGQSYVDAGTVPLRILVLSFAPYAVLMAYYGTCRAVGRLREANALGAAMAITHITAAAVATSHGLPWVATAWVVVTSVFGALAAYRLRVVVTEVTLAEVAP